jgi:hypothetical protein
LKERWIAAGEQRAEEDGVHKTSTTEVDHGCLPGNEEITAGLQTSLSPVNREMWKKGIVPAVTGGFPVSKMYDYAVYFHRVANCSGRFLGELGPSPRRVLTRFSAAPVS